MIRALSVSCVALLGVVLMGATAEAAKPSIAVLGLEVVDPSGTPTQADTAVAEALTKALRNRANTPTGTYQYVPRSEKELVDEKVLNNCNSEGVGCMSTIGKQLGADMLMYGHIERERNGSTYLVTVTLLDITTGKKSGPFSDKLAVGAGDPQLELEAKKLYSRLTGDTGAGTIDVRLQGADRGTIYVDNEPRGTITSGTGEVTGVSEGSHHVAVEVGGFRRWERDVSVTAGETTDVTVDNLERSGGDTTTSNGGGDGSGTTGTSGLGVGASTQTGHPSSALKIVGYSGLAVGAVAGAVWAYAYFNDVQPYDGKTPADSMYDSGHCGTLSNSASAPKGYHQACQGYTMTLVGGITTGVAGAIGVGALIWDYYAHKDKHEQQPSSVVGHRESNKPRFTITPIMSPQGGGMTFRMDW
jgi:hypothetical protein